MGLCPPGAGPVPSADMKHAKRPHRFGRLLASTLLAVTCLAALPDAALAQDVRPKAPPPSKTGDPPKVRNMIMLVVILGIGLGVHAIPSKRGHND